MAEASENLNFTTVSFDRLTDSTSENSVLQPVPRELGAKLHGVSVRYVDEFPSPGAKQDDDQGLPLALRYPGERPEWSFSLVGPQVNPVDMSVASLENNIKPTQVSDPSFYIGLEDKNAAIKLGSYEFSDRLIWNMNDVLKSLEADPFEDRYPIIAFGSNANPGQLAQKFKSLEGADRDVVPTLHAYVKGMVPVYVARIGLKGYVFTDLYPTSNPEVECEVFINFLTSAQLETMDATEKAYTLCEIPNVEIKGSSSNENLITNAYLYAGRDKDSKEGPEGAGILVDKEGRPIRLAELQVNGEGVDKEFAAMTQEEVQEYIYEIASDQIADAFMLKEKMQNKLEIIRMIIGRNKDARLNDFRKEAATKAGFTKNGKFLIGRAINQAVQNAIKSSGKTMSARSIRSIIPAENQNLTIDQLKTFGEIIS
jgi:hypothetical protein